LWALFLLGHLHGTGHIERVLRAPPLRFLGVISFSVYLWHLPIVVQAARVPIHSGLQAALAIVATVLLSSLTYVAIERPFLGLRARRPSLSPEAAGA
jgi:peptidoglycan/LPS O-acetylase OafA/YrhL